ncbi:MAG: RNA polymerase sigma factor [Acidimicrobiales bacterium]
MAASDIERLVEEAKSGDARAFEELVRQTYIDTYTLAYRLTGDEDDARDVVQETYLRVHKGIGLFRGDAHFSTWIHRITANCATTFLGRRGKHRHADLEESEAVIDHHPSRDPEHRADVGDMRAQLTDALRALPPKLRAVVVLRDIYDLSHDAIADELGITESAAKVRLHRARKRLRETLYPMRAEAADDGRSNDADTSARAV